MNQQPAKSVSEQQFNRACDACRLHKVRCLPNNSATSKTCQRCARTDRQCIYNAPQKRKQRKRTDARVAELEREVQAMRALFEKSDAGDGADTGTSRQNISDSSTPASGSKEGEASAGHSERGNQMSLAWEGAPYVEPMGTPAPYSPDRDFIDRGVISLEQATELFESYRNDLVQYCPSVQFSPTVTAKDVRNTKPTLFLAVVAAAASKEGSRLYSILNTEVLSAYAHRTVIQGQKSLDLVQALLVTSIWYYPPGRYSQVKFYEYIHMAATMALDIGLGTNPKTFRRRAGDVEAETPPEELDEEELEKRRTFLACYLITTGVAMSMRRPNMLRMNKWIMNCLEVVASNPRATKLDKYLVSWVRITKIMEELGAALSFDDPGNMPSLAEPSVQLTVSGFERSLEAWKKSSEQDVNDAIMLQYHHTQLYLHEIAMHDDHPPEDFMPPYNLEKILSIQPDSRSSSSYVNATAASISSAQAFLDILIKMDLEVLRMIPVFNYVRMCYSLITLIKLYISAKSPGSPIGAALDPKSLMIGYYLNTLIDVLVEATGPNECRAPYTFLGMVLRVQAWYNSQEHTDIFTPPVSNREAKDCWLPPVAEVSWYKRLEKQQDPFTHPYTNETTLEGTTQPDPLQSLGNIDLNEAGPVQVATPLLPDPGDVFQNLGTDNIDDFLLFDGMDSVPQGDFSNWMPDMSMPRVLDGNQMDEYNWSLQGTGHTPPM